MTYGNQPPGPTAPRTQRFVLGSPVSLVPPNDHLLEGIIAGVHETETGFVYTVKHSSGVERNVRDEFLRERPVLPEKLYRGGFSAAGTPVVTVTEGGTTRTLRDENGREDSFNWGYGGEGPNALARALAKDVAGVEDNNRLTDGLKWGLVAQWPQNEPWTILERHLRTEVEAAR